MTRPLDKHIDGEELDLLVPSGSGDGEASLGPAFELIRGALGHLRSCAECSLKVSKYQQLVDRSSSTRSAVRATGDKCPIEDDVDWHEVAAGLWPELRASQVIGHAALCDHCGPRLRAAARLLDEDPVPQEARLLAALKAPSRPESVTDAPRRSTTRWLVTTWSRAGALALLLLVAGVIMLRSTSQTVISGGDFAELAVHTHERYKSGGLRLDVRTDSQQTLNEWGHQNFPFRIALPPNPPDIGEVRPYQIEGARLIKAGGKSAAFIAYRTDTGPTTMIVTPETAAVASGGVEAKFKRVSFHYTTVEGYKVVTWTQHGSSYALVSEEGNQTQRSCMVCHSAMRDRDLTNTPTPLAKTIQQ